MDVPNDRNERGHLFRAIDAAFKAGDFAALGHALGGAPRWFNDRMPFELGLGHPLEYAIYWSPLSFIRQLIEAGSDPNYGDDGGFPAIIAALSTKRSDQLEILATLIALGADPDRRGVNDWTPLHYAVSLRNAAAVRALLAAGADPSLRARIDDRDTALEAAEAAGFAEGAALLRAALASRSGDRGG
jgi:uncharacterized protein